MKKRAKHLLSAMLALCMTLCMYSLPISAEAASAGTGTKDDPWDISAEAGTDKVNAWYEGSEQSGYTLFITGEGRMTASFRDAEPPWKSIKGSITAVEIGEGVTNAGAYAFHFCKALKTVSLPESLTEIGTYAFHITSVKHLTIPVNVNTIGRMIANPTTYYEVLGNPENVNNHAFNTSLVSVPDQSAAEALNGKTNVSAIIVLNGGIYGETEEDLENLSYGLIAPVKEGSYFAGWYRNADFTGQKLATDRNGRSAVNINNIYYAKWSDTPDPGPDADYEEVLVPEDIDNVEQMELPDGYVWKEPVELIPGGTVTATAVADDGSVIIYYISKNPKLILDEECQETPDGKPMKTYEAGKDDGITVRATGALEKLQSVKVDGKEVDAANYTLRSGSTILTFTKAYMDTLSNGEHTVTLDYEVGSVELLVKVTGQTESTDPMPGPADPTPAPADPTPGPADPAPGPADPTPGPADPTPAPTDPTPGPADPAPGPADPQDPTPAPGNPTDPGTTSPTQPGGNASDGNETPAQENLHSPKTLDNSPYAAGNAEHHNGTGFLLAGLAVTAVLGGVISVLLRRKYADEKEEGRNER
nr:leucine-rich repeat protein [uncultured Acetatifactor sp.]